MEKPYLNKRELIQIVGSKTIAEHLFNHLQELIKKYNYYIPPTQREKLVPTHLVKKELKIKEINLKGE